MKILMEHQILDEYIEQYKIHEIFNVNMRNWMELHYYEQGENVYSIDEKPEYLYFLVKGKLKVYFLLPNGKKVLLRFSKPLGIHGDMELFGEYKVKANLEAVNEAVLIGIKRKNIYDHALNDATFLRFMIQHLSHKLYTVSNAAAINLSYPLENRLASYLISITSDENNVPRIDEIETNNLHELSELLGTSYRHLNRVIKDFANKKIIRKKKNGLLIENIDELKNISAGLYE